MANYMTTSLEATKYLCGLIRDLATVSEGIDDINLRSDGTFSSVMIDTLIKKCLENSNEYTEKLVANLSRLELKLVTSESEITESNILYLFKPDGATSYNQYVVIEGNKVLLGTCDINMADYIKAADVAKDYATKVELKAVTDALALKQPKTLSAPIVVGGVSSTTVEGALGNLNTLVDTKLPMVTSLPANPSNGEAVLYIGTASGGLKTGGIYQYQVSEWVLISYAESFTFNSDDFSVDTATSAVKLTPSRRVFNGSKADWDLLSVAEKTQYGATAFTDDEGGAQSWEDLSSQITTPTAGVTLTDVKCYKKGNLVSLSFDITIASGTILEEATRLFVNIPKPKNINSIHVVSDVSNHQLVWSLISPQDNGYLCPGYNDPCIGVGRTTGLIEYFSED